MTRSWRRGARIGFTLGEFEMMDEIGIKRFAKAMLPAIMSYRPGSTIIYEQPMNLLKNIRTRGIPPYPSSKN